MNKKIWLSLWWWAARGLAHIGVIQRIEELSLEPQEISGTSIGAIIGAFYAAWYSSEDMRKIVSEINILKLIDFDLKHGVIKGNKIRKFLEKYLWEKTFSDLKIPLKIIATDIDTGEKIVFTDGRVVDALRASIGIPGIFTPFRHNNIHLVDGGIMENLPITVLSENLTIIAVSVQMAINKRVRTKKSLFFPSGTMFSNSYGILRKMVGIMMYQNEMNSIQSRIDTIVIRPEREDIDYYNFKKMHLMIDEWYRVAKSILL